MIDRKAYVIQHLDAVDCLSQVFHHQDFISDFTVWPEINIRIFSAGWPDLVKLDLFQRFLTGGRLLGLGSIGAESGYELLEFLDFFFFLFVCFLHLTDQKLAGLVPEVIVSRIELNLSIIDISDLGADLIKEVTVVRDHNDGILKINKEFFQPRDRIQIQVVCRLVKEQNIRITEQRLCQEHFDLLSTGQIFHVLIVEICFDTKSVQQIGCI